MPPADGNNFASSQDNLAALLSEAHHLVTTERTTGSSNLLQIQQVLETAQRQLRRLQREMQIERLESQQERVENGVANIRDNLLRGENGTTRSAEGLRESSSDDGTGGVTSALVRAGQINIIRPNGSPESGVDARDEGGETDGTTTEFDLNPDNVAYWMAAGLNDVLRRLPGREVQNDEEHLMEPDARNHAAEAPSSEANENSPGQPLLYTDLTQIWRDQTFTDITDMGVGYTLSSSAPGPETFLVPMTRVGDAWVIMEPSATQGENLPTITDGNASENSEEEIGALTPLPSPPPPPPPPILSHDTASFSSTGATVGSEVVLDQTTNDAAKKEDLSFSKERRARLIAEMYADIAQHSQKRERAFYREQAYGGLSRIHYPETVQVATHVDNVGGRDIIALTLDEAGCPLDVVAESFRRYDNGTTVWVPGGLSQQLEARRLADLQVAEEFLVHLLQQPDLILVAEQEHYFEEQYVQPGGGNIAKYRFSLVRESGDIETARVEYDRLIVTLTERYETFDTWIRGRHAGLAPTPVPRLMALAEQDGMDIREGVRLLNLWGQWLNNGTIIDRDDPAEFLPMSLMQFWIALRRGWGNWTPSQDMLDKGRFWLMGHARYSNFTYPDLSPERLERLEAELAALGPRGTRSHETPEGQMMFAAYTAQDMSRLRHHRLTINSGVLSESLRDSQGQEAVRDLRVDRLRRLILEEAAIHGRRGARNRYGYWIEEESEEVVEPDA